MVEQEKKEFIKKEEFESKSEDTGESVGKTHRHLSQNHLLLARLG